MVRIVGGIILMKIGFELFSQQSRYRGFESVEIFNSTCSVPLHYADARRLYRGGRAIDDGQTRASAPGREAGVGTAFHPLTRLHGLLVYHAGETVVEAVVIRQ
jgi:hypothetical protein